VANLVLSIIIPIFVLLAMAPLTILGVRFAKRHRGMAHGAATLLLLFGLNMRVDPPPPPRVETVKREEEEAKDDEPE
jgi:hypothetical protein